MADSKLTGLSALTSLTDDDLLYTVNDPLGSPTSRKTTFLQLKNSMTLFVDNTGFNYGFGSNVFAALTTGTNNTFIGYHAGDAVTDSSSNTGIGYNALTSMDTSGGGSGWNTAVGWNALSGPLTSVAIKNTCIGANCMDSNTDGTLNSVLGYQTLFSNTTGSSNTALGIDALFANTDGSSSVGCGYAALLNSTGSPNTAVGANSLHDMTTGQNNTALGYRAGYKNKTGTDCIYIGDQAGYANTVLNTSNQIIIGSATTCNISNACVIGPTSMTFFGFGIARPTHTLSISGESAQTIGMEREASSATSGNNLIINAGGASVAGFVSNTPTVTAGGSGYVVGDVLTISTGNADCTVAVMTLSGSAVATVQRLTNGSGYSTGAGQATTTTGAGTGCTLNIPSVGSSTDKNGGDLILQSGQSTGTGKGVVRVQIPVRGTTGSTDNAYVDRLIISQSLVLTDAATSLFEVALPTLTMTGGSIDWTILASDGTDMQALSGITNYASVNKGGVYTDTITNNTSNDAKAVSAGTLTCVWSILDGTNKITIRVTPTGSLTETTYRITMRISNNSPQAITLL